MNYNTSFPTPKISHEYQNYNNKTMKYFFFFFVQHDIYTTPSLKYVQPLKLLIWRYAYPPL